MSPVVTAPIGTGREVGLPGIIDLRIVLKIVGTVYRPPIYRMQRISHPMRHMERFVVAERIVAHGAVIERSEVVEEAENCVSTSTCGSPPKNSNSMVAERSPLPVFAV